MRIGSPIRNPERTPPRILGSEPFRTAKVIEARMRLFRTAMKWLLGLLFAAAGVLHFASPDPYVAIVPPYLPWPLALVYLSGAAEVALGLMLLVPRVQSLAAWGLIALLIAVFPANLHMALNPDSYPTIPPVALWGRLPLQAVLIAWAYWFTGRVSPSGRS